MTTTYLEGPASAGGTDHFAATRWTVVLAAQKGTESPRAEAALAELCGTYWYPLYAYLRRRGFHPPAAEDLTQEFFSRLLARNALQQVDRRRGKFRAFLLASLKNFLANEWDRATAQKRGGHQTVLSLDAATAETRYGQQPVHELTPEKIFDRQWALLTLEKVLAALQAEYAAEGKADLFNALEPFLAGEGPSTYAAAAQRVRLTEAAFKMAVHRLRSRYRHLLRQEIAQTVATPEEIKDEIRHLFAALR